MLGEDDGAWAADLLEVTDGRHLRARLVHPAAARAPDDADRWHRVRTALLARAIHARPSARDDKVVAGWNGLAIAALAEIGAVLERPDLIDAARGAADLVWDLTGRDDRLRRVSRDGVAGRPAGVLEDYAERRRGLACPLPGRR